MSCGTAEIQSEKSACRPTATRATNGEDCKEVLLLDSKKTHSYMKFRYKYRSGFTLRTLVSKNRHRRRGQRGVEMVETGVFNEKATATYRRIAKHPRKHILIRHHRHNLGPETTETRPVQPFLRYATRGDGGHGWYTPAMHAAKATHERDEPAYGPSTLLGRLSRVAFHRQRKPTPPSVRLQQLPSIRKSLHQRLRVSGPRAAVSKRFGHQGVSATDTTIEPAPSNDAVTRDDGEALPRLSGAEFDAFSRTASWKRRVYATSVPADLSEEGPQAHASRPATA